MPESEVNTQLMARALVMCALEASGEPWGNFDVEYEVSAVLAKVRPRFQRELTVASRIACELNAECVAGLKIELSEEGLFTALSKIALDHFSEDELKTSGAVHTPLGLARHIVRQAHSSWKRQNTGKPEPKFIGDLGVGAGSFFYAFHVEGLGSNSSFVGIDKHMPSVLCAELIRIGIGEDWQLYCADSLIGAGGKSGDPKVLQGLSLPEFELLVGNPPYVRSAILGQEYISALRKQFPLLGAGNFDLSVAFLEQATRLLSPNGVFTYLTSSKFSNSKYGEGICQELRTNARVLSVEDFGSAQVFPGFTAYVLIITIANASPAKRFQVTSVDWLDDQKSLIAAPVETLKVEEALQFPWSFLGSELSEIRRKVTASRFPSIKQFFPNIFQGVRTGANQVFVIEHDIATGLESDLLVPFVTGREIKRQQVLATETFLVYPYVFNEHGSAVPLAEAQLFRQFPKTYQHLLSHKSQLIERSMDESSHWAGFSRNQNLSGHLRPKIFVKEMMPRAEFAADESGGLAFGSGYALDGSFMDPEQLIGWTAVLNTPIMEFVLRSAGTQLHSSWFRILKHQLLRIRFPAFTQGQMKRVMELGATLEKKSDPGVAKVLEAELNLLVASGYGLSPEESLTVDKFLEPLHKKSMGKALEIDTDLDRVTDKYEPVKLEKYNELHRESFELRQLVTFRNAKTKPIHSWYPYTQGFDEDLVFYLAEALELKPGSIVLDPFGGVGTTGIACRKLGFKSILSDVSPLVNWVSQVKNSEIDVERITLALDSGELSRSIQHPRKIQLNQSLFSSFFDSAYEPEVLDKVLRILAFLEDSDFDVATVDFLRLMLVGKLESMSNIRKHGSHYRYLNSTTSIGLAKLNIPLFEAKGDVYSVFEGAILRGLEDLKATSFALPASSSKSLLRSAKSLGIRAKSVDAIITSPPYLNRNNYIAQQKGELALLGFIGDTGSYKELVRATLVSHVEGSLPPTGKSEFPDVNTLISLISLEEGNNPKIPNMISGYFADLNEVLIEMWRVSKPGAKLAFVVGNTRWGGVVIPVDHLLMSQAEAIGFKPERILVTRMKGNSPQQMRRFGRIPVRESIVVFSKP